MKRVAEARGEGFSLIDLIIALVILSGVVLSIAEYARRFSPANASTSTRPVVTTTTIDRF
jgi:Tfp pilus assembly protein PilV